MIVKTGLIAGAIWNALNEQGAMTLKELKKATKARRESDVCLGLGWLMREDKLDVSSDEEEPKFSLK